MGINECVSIINFREKRKHHINQCPDTVSLQYNIVSSETFHKLSMTSIKNVCRFFLFKVAIGLQGSRLGLGLQIRLGLGLGLGLG